MTLSVLALVKDGVVVNAIVVSDESPLAPGYLALFDAAVTIPTTPGSPGVGWLYDGHTFSPPPPSEPESP